MVIKSLKHEYFVLVMLKQDMISDTMIATYDRDEINNPLFMMIRIKDLDIIMKLTSFFLDLDRTYFTDFQECFILEREMVLVFDYVYGADSELLINMAPHMKLKQRIQMVRVLLSTIILQCTPYPVLCAVLKPENILLCNDTNVFFHYNLENYDDYQYECKNKAMVHLSYLLGILFEKEIQFHRAEALTMFIHNIGENAYDNMPEVYKAFAKIYDGLLALEETPEPPTKTLAEKMEELKKFFLKWIGPVLAVGMIGAALFYLYTTAVNPTPSTSKGEIKMIGELLIEEYE